MLHSRFRRLRSTCIKHNLAFELYSAVIAAASVRHPSHRTCCVICVISSPHSKNKHWALPIVSLVSTNQTFHNNIYLSTLFSPAYLLTSVFGHCLTLTWLKMYNFASIFQAKFNFPHCHKGHQFLADVYFCRSAGTPLRLTDIISNVIPFHRSCGMWHSFTLQYTERTKANAMQYSTFTDKGSAIISSSPTSKGHTLA